MNREPVPQYDKVTRAIHWLVATLAIVVVAAGWAIIDATYDSSARELLLRLHRSVGMVILLAMLAWGLWRLVHRLPPLPHTLTRVEIVLARAMHGLLHLAFIAVPLSGYVAIAASGHTVDFFGLAIPPLMAENEQFSQIAVAVHLAGQFVIYLLVAVHAAAAMMHLWVRRDGVFERMLPLRRAR